MKHLAFHQNLVVHPEDSVDFAYAVALVKKDEDQENVYSNVSASFTLLSMVTFVTELASSVAVCYLLFPENPFWWFAMTIVLLITSLLAVNIFSMRWYIHDLREENKPCVHASVSHWVLRIVFHGTLLGPVIRYLELFLYGIHSRDVLDPFRQEYKLLVLREDRDTSFLALIGCFTKSAPMLILQIYIILHRESVELMTNRAQWVNVCLSLIGLSLSLMSYHRALRRSLLDKNNMTQAGSAMQFLSHVFIIGCRAFALAAFASEFGLWIFFLCGVHWILMVSWLILQRTDFCSTGDGERRHCDEIWFNAIAGIVYIFCFLNVKDEPTRWKYALYYVLAWVENIIIISLWYGSPNLQTIWYRLHMFLGVIFSFFVGIFILMIYYRFLHPNKVNKQLIPVKLPFPVS